MANVGESKRLNCGRLGLGQCFRFGMQPIRDGWLFATMSGPGVLIVCQLGSANLIRSLLNYVRLPVKTLSLGGLFLASTIIIAGLAAWILSDFSDALAAAEMIVSSTAMDTVASNSLQAVGVL